MHPMSHAYHEEQIERFSAAFAPFHQTLPLVIPKLYVAAGEPIFSSHEHGDHSYLITSGEVVILRDGFPVDLLEEDETIDLALWPDTVALAHRSCTLVPLNPLANRTA